MSSEDSGNDALAPQAPRSVPITVSITRTVDPAKIPDATRWVQSGVNLANQYPGFLGSGWVRASADSWDWHMLYRFSSVERLDAWESSAETVVADLILLVRSPPRWKQAVSIWLGFVPGSIGPSPGYRAYRASTANSARVEAPAFRSRFAT
jgi:antibiotic biosynthesis monooxygenase (ABM) superfamily enzyme